MRIKKILLRIALPPLPVLLLAITAGIAVPTVSLAVCGAYHPVTYIGYALSFYALMLISLRIPRIIFAVRTAKNGDGIIGKLWRDPVKKLKFSVTLSLIFNTGYTVLNVFVAVTYRSLWSLVIGAYYVPLTLLRLFLFRYVRRPGDFELQLKRCRMIGVLLVLIHAALSGMIVYITTRDDPTGHGEIMTITMALYTFAATYFAISGLVRYRRLKSPVFSLAKEIDLTAALVSMLMLERVMLATFGDGNRNFTKAMIYSSGGVIAMFIFGLALYTVIGTTLKLKKLRNSKNER